MATTEQQLESFMRFVRHRAGTGDAEPSLDELFDLWRHENPSGELYAQNVAAIAAERCGRGNTLSAVAATNFQPPPRHLLDQQ